MNSTGKLAIGFALLTGILVLMPNIIHMTDSRYQGVPVHINADEHSYLSHLNEALRGRFGQAGKGITAESVAEPSFHLAPIEETYGILFGWTSTAAADLLVVMDFVIPALLFFAVFTLLTTLGFDRRHALVGAALFSVVLLYSLGRPIQQRTSFLLLIIALIGLTKGTRIWSIIAGLLMGLLVGIYVWSWTAMWCVWGVMILLMILSKIINPAAESRDSPLRDRILTGIVGAIAASPFIYHLLSVRSHPAYEDTVLRSGLIDWRMPESIAWSVLTTITALATLDVWRRRGWSAKEIPIVAIILSGFIVLNQQLIHGKLLMFRSHYMFFLALSAVIAFLYAFNAKSILTKIVLFVSSVLILLLTAYDNRFALDRFTPKESRFQEQHLASTLPILERFDRAVILSDPDTSAFLAAHTKHDVLYTRYLQHTLITHEEIAKKFCLTQIPLSEEDREIEGRQAAYGNAISSEQDLKKKEHLRTLDQELVTSTCEEIDRSRHKELLDLYNIEYVLWDKIRSPKWDLERIRVPMERIADGEGWALWRKK